MNQESPQMPPGSQRDPCAELQEAYDEEDFDLVQSLLRNTPNLDPNCIDIRYVSSARMLKILSDFGFDFKSKGHLILQDFSGDAETLYWLLDQGADVSLTDTSRLDTGRKLMQGESDHSLHVLNNVAAAGDIDLFDTLVSRGADPARSLALHSVSRCEDPTRATAMVKHLLERHSMDIDGDSATLQDLSHETSDSGTPLCSAIDNQNLAVVKELLRKGADIHKRGECGFIPLYKAIGYISVESFLPALGPLLEAGASPDHGLRYAISQGSTEAAQVCLEHGAGVVPALEEVHKREQTRLEKEVPHGKSWYDAWLRDQESEKDKNQAMIVLLSSWQARERSG